MRVLVIEQRGTDAVAIVRPVRKRYTADQGRVTEPLADYYAEVFGKAVNGDARLHADACSCPACGGAGEPAWRPWDVVEADTLPPRESRNRWRLRDGAVVVVSEG